MGLYESSLYSVTFQTMKWLLLFCLALAPVLAADYRAGVATVDITPESSIWLSGYGSRSKPSTGVLQRISAKALAVEDRRGQRVVIVTTDLIGLPRALTDLVGARVEKEFGLGRANLLLNSSHTHTGPMVRSNLSLIADFDEKQQGVIDEYARLLADQLVTIVGSALSGLKPATLAYGEGSAGFAANRREHTADGVKIGVNPNGLVDHRVPVLRIAGDDGKPIAILFGYACHNTTLTGETYTISGDYAGFAQADLEQAYSGSTALFLQLCAGDQNPNPRGTEQYAEQHGRTLAAEVRRVLDGKLIRVRGRLNSVLQWKDLPLQPYARGDFETMLQSADPMHKRFATAMLKALDERRAPRSIPYPVQAVRLGDGFVLVALGGEPVVEYALKIRAANPKLRMIVAGYSNDVMGYIPTAKMLQEGGYEPVGSTLAYGLPASFAPEVETAVLAEVNAAVQRVMR